MSTELSYQVVWLRHDLRLHDNPALLAALAKPSILLFTGDGVELERMGAASRVYLFHALQSFRKSLQDSYSAPLMIHPGPIERALADIKRVVRIGEVVWNTSYEPRRWSADQELAREVKAQGWSARACASSLLFDPNIIRNKSGLAFRVFTPFYKHLLSLPPPHSPLPKPQQLHVPHLRGLEYDRLVECQLLPKQVRWDVAMMQHWQVDENSLIQELLKFLESRVHAYPENRDRPAVQGTSKLSPALRFGLISPRQVWHLVSAIKGPGAAAYLRQIVWREFACHSLYHQPKMEHAPILSEFERFRWQAEPRKLRAWQQGRTGYPIIDAGMRELWQTGWMHNRVRMIVGSFLVKNLLQPWQSGAAWFWDTLVDADLANNSMGWQWVAGCGIDPAPYFRIFNPMLQGLKFDPQGAYTKKWLPELARLPAAQLQAPWELLPEQLRQAGVRLGENYPQPIVDFKQSRQQALAEYQILKGKLAAPTLFDQLDPESWDT